MDIKKKLQEPNEKTLELVKQFMQWHGIESNGGNILSFCRELEKLINEVSGE